MAPETWTVLTMGAAFLLLGAAISPLAWVALSYHRTRSDRETNQRFLELDELVRALRDRLQNCENALAELKRLPGRGGDGSERRPDEHLPRGPHWLGRRPQPPRAQGPRFQAPDSRFVNPDSRLENPGPLEDQISRFENQDSAAERGGAEDGPSLIHVPRLDAAPDDRRAALEGLAERHAAIWNLRDAGASAEMIARATGQPIGQIELILGLRRQIDGVRTARPHGGHSHE